jgi:lipoprotein NlpI
MYSNSKRKISAWVLVTLISLVVPVTAQNTVTGGQPASVTILDSTKDQDGLLGSVRRVKIQSAKLEFKSGQLVEGPPRLLEVTTYGLSGNRIDNVSYPIPSFSVGNEEYKYDDRGHIIEMTLRADDGSILSRENYEYEFDTFGNWRKMVTSLVLFENGGLKHEPVEVTYRALVYYFDDSVAKIAKPHSHQITLPTPSFTFPGLANVLSSEPRFDKVTISERPPLFEIGSDPPALPGPAKTNDVGIPTRSKAESNKASDAKAGPLAISSTLVNNRSAEVTMSTVSAPKETANSVPAARKDAVAYYLKGREYFDSGALNKAVDSYLRSLELEPRSAEVFLSLGHAYLRLNNREAGKAFKEATRLNPQLTDAYYGLGLHYLMLGRNKNAADSFKRATLLYPNLAKAHYGLALAYQELGKLDALVAEYRILETLDRSLAKKLADTVNLACRVAPFCK